MNKTFPPPPHPPSIIQAEPGATVGLCMGKNNSFISILEGFFSSSNSLHTKYMYIKGEASPSIYADWVNGGRFLET